MNKQEDLKTVVVVDKDHQLIEMNVYNNTSDYQPITFKGALSTPLICDYMNVVRFRVPNNNIPIMINFSNTRYQFSMSYNGTTVSRYVSLDNRNTENHNVEDMDTLVTSLNTCLSMLVSQLNASRALPSLVVPYLYYDNQTNLFNFVVLTEFYNTSGVSPIRIYCNKALKAILDSFPMTNTGATDTAKYQFLFRSSYETTYRTTYTKVQQESITLSNYASPQRLQISAEGTPIETMTILQNRYGSNTSNVNTFDMVSYPVVQNYSFNYNGGSIDLKSTNDYYIVNNRFREVRTGLNNSYLQFSVSYVTNDGSIYPVMLSPFTSANLLLQFTGTR